MGKARVLPPHHKPTKTDMFGKLFYSFIQITWGLQDRARSLGLLGLLVGRASGTRGSCIVCASIMPANFTDDFIESLFDIDTSLGRSLQERTIQGLAEVAAFAGLHFAFVFQIALVAQDDHGVAVFVLDAQNLVAERLDGLEGGTASNRINNQEALARSNVLVAHGRIFFLASRVEDIQQADFAVDFDLLAVGVFNGRIIFVHEMILGELSGVRFEKGCGSTYLNGQGRFTDTTITDNDEFVQEGLGHV